MKDFEYRDFGAGFLYDKLAKISRIKLDNFCATDLFLYNRCKIMVICQRCYSLKLIEIKCSAWKKPEDNTQEIFSDSSLVKNLIVDLNATILH